MSKPLFIPIRDEELKKWFKLNKFGTWETTLKSMTGYPMGGVKKNGK